MPRGVEDEVVFQEDGCEGRKVRILRGTIIREDADFLTIARDDGVWSIRRAFITKIRRAPAPREVRP